MAGNFGSIGLVVEDQVQLQELVIRLASAAGERLATDAGEYAVWRSRTGAELWFHLGPASDGEGAEREIIGVTPFFEGRSEVTLEIENAIKRADDNSHEGAFHGCLTATPGGAKDRRALTFEAVDFGAHCDRPLPAQWTVRLTGFAREVRSVPGSELVGERMVSRPAGLTVGEEHSATVTVNGQIVSFAELANEFTEERFYWMLVECGLGALDIVAHPEVCADADLAPGTTVNIDCMLFGRILN